MNAPFRTLLASAALVAAVAVPGAAAHAASFPTTPADDVTTYSGWCPFDVTVSTWGTAPEQRVFTDRSGAMVKIIQAGKGTDLRFAANGRHYDMAANGAVMNLRFLPDGTMRLTMTGHNVLVLFASDLPAGPSSTLVVGRAVVDISPDQQWTLVSTSGTTVDLCAAVS